MPKYILIVGVNGAGKSTLCHSLEDVLNVPRVNTDDIVRTFGDWRVTADVIKAGKIAVESIREYFDKRESFQQETTLCGRSIINNIMRAKNLGYTVDVYYVGVASVEIAKDRVEKRVANGGHGVSADIIERRYYESFENMKEILDQCDTVSFYDNTVKFRRVAIYRNGQLIREAADLPKWYTEHIK